MALNDGSRLNMSSKPLGCFIGGRGGVYPKTSSQAMAGGYCCIDFDSLQLKDGWDGSFAGMVHGMHSRCTCSARMAECFFCGGGRPFFGVVNNYPLVMLYIFHAAMPQSWCDPSIHACHHRCFKPFKPTRQPLLDAVYALDFIVLHLRSAHACHRTQGHFIDELVQQCIGFNWYECAKLFSMQRSVRQYN